MKKTILLLACLSLSATASAMFCPKNFNQINMGDSIEQVEKQCGKPDFEKKSKGEDDGPQLWTYYVHPQMKDYTQMRTNSNAVASVKMEVAFNLGKVINLTVNSMSLATTTICGPNVSIGDTTKSVKRACGEPTMPASKEQNGSDGKKLPEIMEYKYSSSPPVSLIFTNGILTERK